MDIETLKRKIKHRTPEIIVATSVLVGSAAVVYIAKSLKADVPLNYVLDLPKSALTHMIEEKQDMLIESPKLLLRVHIGSDL